MNRTDHMTNYEQIFERLGGIDQTRIKILEQTKRTNGRVSALEEWREEVRVRKSFDTGFSKGRMRIITVLIAALAFVIGSVITPIVAALIQAYRP